MMTATLRIRRRVCDFLSLQFNYIICMKRKLELINVNLNKTMVLLTDNFPRKVMKLLISSLQRKTWNKFHLVINST